MILVAMYSSHWQHYSMAVYFFKLRRDRVKLAELLVNVGANINSKNAKGLTPLMVASGIGAVDVLKLLATQPKNAIDMQVRSIERVYGVIANSKN